ncbi:Hypothetical predicted protein [Marmota monax]|uniref:Uncharacterized protein n=1 Tax=Marmota monax TaxID=9995 RepID=A0A5E4BKN0_MARMO|nr:Hypothetical predicted protein [Marmota monax]
MTSTGAAPPGPALRHVVLRSWGKGLWGRPGGARGDARSEAGWGSRAGWRLRWAASAGRRRSGGGGPAEAARVLALPGGAAAELGSAAGGGLACGDGACRRAQCCGAAGRRLRQASAGGHGQQRTPGRKDKDTPVRNAEETAGASQLSGSGNPGGRRGAAVALRCAQVTERWRAAPRGLPRHSHRM